MHSIRRKLLITLIGALLAAGFTTAAATFFSAQTEFNKFLDTHLKETAESLAQSVTHSFPLADPDHLTIIGDAQSYHIVVQVYDSANNTVWQREDQPYLPLPDAPGFARAKLNGVNWRTYSTPAGPLIITVGQDTAVRTELAASSAFRVLQPLCLLLPFIAIAVWIVVGSGLAPLEKTARSVARRSPTSLEPISTKGLPLELAGLVSAINQLLDRLRESLSAQQRFASDAAHELRTPLTALKLQVQLAQRAKTDEAREKSLMRLNEGDEVEAAFKKWDINFVRVNAEGRFLSKLAGISDPERKRKIIGEEFIRVFEEESKKIGAVDFLAQGTIYPDVIESAGAKTKKAKTIKSHHNVGGLPDTLHLKLLEPLRSLFKDEVRELGVELGLPAEMVYRHPFPGPGLGVRILGEVKREYADLLREADAIFIEELRNFDLYDKVSQAFVVFLPVKSVGVMGDGRTYEWVVSLRCVETSDFMTAVWSHLPYELLGKVSNRIINEVRGINRVVYDVSGKPPATIEWE